MMVRETGKMNNGTLGRFVVKWLDKEESAQTMDRRNRDVWWSVSPRESSEMHKKNKTRATFPKGEPRESN